MKPCLMILLLAFAANAQSLDGPEWKLIKEASGPLTEYAGLNIETYVSSIARGDGKVRLWIRFDFPQGAPMDLFPSFDVGSVRLIAAFDCNKQTLKAVKGQGFIYNREGTFIKTVKDHGIAKELPRTVSHYVLEYFCERPAPPAKKPPTLKP